MPTDGCHHYGFGCWLTGPKQDKLSFRERAKLQAARKRERQNRKKGRR